MAMGDCGDGVFYAHVGFGATGDATTSPGELEFAGPCDSRARAALRKFRNCRLDVSDAGALVSARDLHTEYVRWCYSRKFRAMGAVDFASTLVAMFAPDVHVDVRAVINERTKLPLAFIGVRLVDAASTPTEAVASDREGGGGSDPLKLQPGMIQYVPGGTTVSQVERLYQLGEDGSMTPLSPTTGESLDRLARGVERMGSEIRDTRGVVVVCAMAVLLGSLLTLASCLVVVRAIGGGG